MREIVLYKTKCTCFEMYTHRIYILIYTRETIFYQFNITIHVFCVLDTTLIWQLCFYLQKHTFSCGRRSFVFRRTGWGLRTQMCVGWFGDKWVAQVFQACWWRFRSSVYVVSYTRHCRKNRHTEDNRVLISRTISTSSSGSG